MVYTVGYNGYGQMGNGTVQNLITPWCISKLKIEVTPHIINYKNIGEDSKKITYKMTMGFNLIKDTMEGGTYKFSTLDSSIATVDENTGVVTAQGIGATYIKVHNKENDIWAAVKVNVNGKQGNVQPKIVGGYNHFVALKANGTVWTWGYNANGELGLGDNQNRTEPTQVKAEITLEDGTTKEEEITDAIDVAAGANHTLILRKDGTVWATGYNNKGQLGDGTTKTTNKFHKVKGENGVGYLQNIVQIAAENNTSHALTADGSVYSYGYNYYGQFGNNTTTDENANPYPVKMQKVSNIIQITAGEQHISMLDADGSVWSTGYNGYGQFGIGTADTYNVLPTQMKDTKGSILYGVKEIASGTYHTALIKEDNTAWSVGYNGGGYGILGQGKEDTYTTTISQVKEQVEGTDGQKVEKAITDAKHITASGYTTYITRQKTENGEPQGMYVSGYNPYGQLFTKDTTNRKYATPVETDKDILTASTTKNVNIQTGAIADINGNVYTVGYNGYGGIGNGTTESSINKTCISQVKLQATPSIINYKKAGDSGKQIEYTVSAGFNLLYDTIDQGNCEFKTLDSDVATVDEDGVVTATGVGTTYIRIYNKQNDCYAAVKVQVNGEQGRTAAKIVGGWNHFAALKANGEVWTWGHNGYGQLGVGNTERKIKPTKTNIYDSKDTTQTEYAIDVAAGAYHTLVLKSDGTVWTTGYNGYGQLGTGTTQSETEFKQVTGIPEKVIAITANVHTSYALTESGKVYGWGYNYYGQLGINNNADQKTPVKMQKVSNIIQISAGDSYITMLDANGSVWNVGYNGNGQFGVNNYTTYYLPQQMKTEDGSRILQNIKKVSAGATHTIVLSDDGIAYSTGYNGYGQLGIGDTTTKILPTKMIDTEGNVVTRIKDIEANGYSSMISVKPTTTTDTTGNQTTTAGIYIAGYNNYGQLYTKNAVSRTNLTKVQEDKNIITMASTKNPSYQTSAIADDLGLVYTVGYNGNGEMGDDSTSTTTEPTSISDASLKVNTRKIQLNLNTNNITKQIEANTDLGFNILFDQVTNEQISYKTQDDNIATVNNTGLVTGKKYGTTKIEVTTNKLPNTVLVEVEVLRKDDITMPKTVSGQDFTVALKSDGTVWTWGYNGYGQLGLGDKSNRYKPTQINITDVVDIAAGNNHVLLVTKDGKVYSYGTNSYGQLGRDGNTLLPEEIPNLENIEKVAASNYHSMALGKDGSVYTWGYNGNGQLGNGTTISNSIPSKIRLTNITKIEAGEQTSTAIDGDGNLYAYGYNGYGQLGNGTTTNIYLPRKVLSLDNIVDVAVENGTIVAVNKQGEVYASGYNGYGNLGNNTTQDSTKFEKVIEKIDTTTTDTETTETPTYLTGVKSVTAGLNYVIATKEDGTAITWGINSYAQSSNGTTTNNLLPVALKYSQDQDKIDKIISISAGDGTTVVAREDGKVWTIGKNNYGQLGDSSVSSKKEFVCISKPILLFEETPIRIKGIGNTKNAQVNMSQGFNLLYNKVDNTDFTYEIKNTKVATVDKTTGKITSVKKGKTSLTVIDKISGQTTSADVYVLGADDITFPQILSNNYATLTLKSNGEIWSYGYNGYGQLGTGDTSNKILPTYTGTTNIVQIGLGTTHAIAVDTDGHVWTWGYNGYGQLGNGTTSGTTLQKQQVKSPDGKGVLENIVSVAAGDSYSVALDKNGNVYTWGYNGYGNLGLGNTDYRTLPVKVDNLQGIIKIAAGNVSTFAIDNNNHLWAAGYNGYGNLGDGTTGDKTQFTKLQTIENVAEVSVSPTNSTIALLLDGTVWGFGHNANNQLTNVGGAIPQQLQGPDGALKDITSIGTGYYTGYAITSEEKVVAWGLDNYSQLASTETGTTKETPVYMKDKDGNDFTDAMIVSGGIYNTELAKNDGTVWSIGYNGYGELGDGSSTSKAKIETISTQYVKLQEREATLKLSNPNYQINPTTVYGFNLLFDEIENKGFTYKSSDETIAKVDETTGKVTATGLGRAYITVTAKGTEEETRVVINVIAENKKVKEKVETGHIHSLALKQDGTIWSWGDNTQGEMGNGTISSIKTTEPTQIEKGKYKETQTTQTPDGSTQTTTTEKEVTLNNIKDIAAGYYYNLAVDSEGQVYSWGYNGYGQLGDNTTESKSIPTRIEGLGEIEKVYINGNTSMAINKQGEIYIWGYEYSKTPEKLNFYSKAVDIHGKLILAEDGSVWNISGNTPSRIAELKNIIEIASGDSYYSALDTKGQVWVWGYNGYGQLSQGNTNNINEPTTVKIEKPKTDPDEETQYETLQNIVEIKAGNQNLEMITNTGEIYVSGYNGNGQLGIGKYSTYNTIAVKSKNMDQTKLIDSNSYHSIASDRSGFVYTTGYNAQGQLGNGTYTQSNEFTVIGDTYVHVSENRISIEKGKDKQVTASLDNKFNLINDTVDSGNISYETLNSEIATVDQDGTIHGKKIGTVEIIVTHTITHKTSTIFVQVVPEGKITVPKLEIGDTHSAALKADGTVWTWGNNSNGQLGTGNNTSKTSPIKVMNIQDVIDLSVGYYDTAVVKKDGTVWTWGYNGYGQLGEGTSSDRSTPVQVIKPDGAPLTKIVKVSAGTYRTVALDEEGNVWVWGYGYGSTATKLTTINNVIDISPNYAVTQTGEVYKIDGQKLTISNIIRVSEGANHALFLTKTGKGYSVGTNNKGQLGDGTTVNKNSPVMIQNSTGIQTLSEIKELKAGTEYSMAIMKNGDTYTWGSNENSKLGTTQDNYTVYPKKNEQTNPSIFGAAGPNNTGIIDEEGYVYTWGLGKYGNLGNRLYNTTSEPVLVGAEEAGLDEYDIILHPGETHQITVTNKTFNVLKEIQETGTINYNIGNSGIASISSTGLVTGQKEGKTTAIVTKADTGATSIANVTVLPAGVEIEPMALTCMSHTVVLKANGTVWAYGLNSSYELGNGNTKSSDRPLQIKFPDGVKIKQIAVGNTHNLALDTEGNVWGWGVNSNNSLGTTSSTPVYLGINNVKKIAANNDQSMILTKDGYVYVWGLNSNGELGIGTYNRVTTPTLLDYVNNVLDISLGKNHTIILTTNGKILTSGLNSYGQTGKDGGKSNTFTEIEVQETIGKISAGDNHSVLLSVAGNVYTYGYNENGQLGLGTKTNVTKPTKTNMTNIMEISAGRNHTVVLGANRVLYSTGSNSNGQLGIGTKDDKLLFTEITKVQDMMSISSGNTYSVAIKYDGDVYGWGDYYHGTSSVKTKTNSRIPVKIGNDSAYAEEPEITVNVNRTKQIEITPKYSFNVFKEEDEEDSDFTFTSINEDIAKVNEKGLVTGVKVGTTWARVTEKTTGKENIVIVRVIEEDSKYASQISGGDGYATVLKADGSIWGFGYNSDGQLGNDKLAPINVPSQTNILATYKQIKAGKKFTVALREDGTVWAYGDNTYGQLGQGNRVSAKKPVQVQNLTNIVSIAAGDNHAIAIDNLGNVYTWGLNSKGQLGNGTTQTVSIPEKITGLDNQMVKIAAGGNLSAIIDSTGDVYVFGDNSKEQIEEFKYNYDQYGQKIMPPLNMYVTQPVKVQTIENAVKVQCLQTGIVVLKTDESVERITKYASQTKAQKETIATGEMVDISGTNESVVLLDKNGESYTYGDNSKGQAGIGGTSANVTLKKVQMVDAKTYLAIGAGYKNNYIIDTEGFVYGAGANEYGQLGNSSYDDSYNFTLIGDRKFEIVPDARIMKQPEEETVKIISNIFNVFNHNERKLTDYDWKSSNTDVVTVNNGILTSQDMGVATITATDKVTGATATALRVVQPLDEQRIENITVNDKTAKVSGENKYAVSVEKRADGTGTLKIKTKDATDQISIDGGTTYATGTLEKDINIDTNPTIVKIKVKTTNGKFVDYILTINIISSNASLEELTVDNVQPTSVGATEYEIIIKDSVTKPEVHAVASDSNSTVSIDASIPEKKQTTKTIDMTTTMKKTIPIQVTAENGEKVTYTLTIYKEDSLTELETVTVDGKEATKISDTSYKAIIPAELVSSTIEAKTLYTKAKAEINKLGEEVHVTKQVIATIGNETIVKIYVRFGEGENEREKEYTLILDKEGTEDIQGLLSVTVNGHEIQPVGNIYNANIGEIAQTATVTAITISDKDLVKIGETNSKEHISTEVVDCTEIITTYKITVTDPNNPEQTKEYVLNIKKPSADNTLLSLTVGNQEFSKEATRIKGTNTYKVSISDRYNEINVIGKANYEQAKVSINGEEYEAEISTRLVQIGENEPTKIGILVKALNGEIETYTLEIYKENSNTNLKEVTVDGNKAEISKIAENTYEYTLDKKVDTITIGAIAEETKTKVGINTNEQEEGATYRKIKMEGKRIVVNIPVTAEDGTTKTYTLIINALPDNVNLLSVKVEGKAAEAVPVNQYEARVNKNATSFELYVIPEDPKAKVQIDNNIEVTGTASATIPKNTDKAEVKIKVTAQDGTTEEYTLIVTNQSDDCKLAILKVDGEILEPDEQGKYHVTKKFLTESVEVEAIANNSHAQININTLKAVQEEQKATVTTPDAQNTITITVTAEDGTAKKYTLIVEKLPNNTEAEITIIYKEEEKVKIKDIEIDENNKGTIRIGKQEEVDIKVVAKDKLAQISIKGGLNTEHQVTEKIITTEETTKVPVQVTAQDGTIRNYEITIIKASNNNNLEKLEAEGINQSDITQVSENKYEIKMPDTMNNLKLKGTAENEYATVKIAEGTYSTNNIQEETIEINETEKEIKLYVKAENGDIKEYTIAIKKVTDLRAESIKVNDTECILENGNYIGFVDRNSKQAGLKIKPKNPTTLISIKTGINGKWDNPEAKEEHIKQITLEGEETTVLIKAQDPNDPTRTKEYSVIIKYKSDNADLEIIQVDGKDAIKTDEGYYSTTTMEATTSKIYVKASNKYAKIEISTNQAEQGESTKTVTLSKEKKTTVTITITAQDNTTKVYTLVIERKSTDTSCTIQINNQPADEIDTATNTYVKYIERTDTEATILVRATSDEATVEIAGDTKLKALAKTIEIASETTEVDTIVTAENGEKAVYHIKVVKKSTDTSIKTVKVDNKIISETDGKYIATVYDKGRDTQDTEIEITATEAHAKIQIGDGTEWKQTPATKTETFKDGNRKITLNINIQAQDGETPAITKVLEINIISDDVSIKLIKNGENVVTKYDSETHTYKEYISADTEQVSLSIEANNQYTTLKSGETEGKPQISINNISVKDQEEVDVKVTAIAETGRTQQYTIKLLRKSKNADASHIYVDNTDIIDRFVDKDSVPTSIISIPKEKDLATIKVISANEYASIKIGDTEELTENVTRNIKLPLEDGTITVPIVITSQDGTVTKTYNIMFVRLSNDTKIQWLEVNKKHIIEDENGNYEITVKATEEIANVKIVLSNILAKVTMGGEEKEGQLEESIILPNGDTIKTITVTALDGTVKKYKLTIHKQQNNLGLEKVYLDGRKATKVDDNTFEIDVKKGTTKAEIKAIATKQTEYVSVNGNLNTQAQNTNTNCSLENKQIPIRITAMFEGEVDETKDYILKIKEVEEPDVLEDLKVTIKLDDEEIEQDTDGNYVKVVDASQDNSSLWAGITSETSQVKIKDGNGETEYANPSSQKNLSLKNGVTEATVTVKNGAGEEKEYKVYVIKDTEDISNNNIQEIIAGQGAVTEGTITPEADGTYTTYIKKDATTIELTAKAQYPYSKVSIEGNRETRGTNTTTINMGNTAEKQIIVKITSIDGDVQQYLVNIYREPSELYLKQVYVDNRLTTRTDDQNFTIDIVKGTKTVDIKAILYDQNEYVSIAGNTGTQYQNTLQQYDVSQGKTIKIIVSNKLDKTADDYKEKEYTLTLTEVDKPEDLQDLQLTIKVDEQEVQKTTDGIYIAKVDKNKVSSMVEGISNSSTTKVKINDTPYQVKRSKEKIDLTEDVTKVIITAKNAAENELKYTLYILKENSPAEDDASLKEVKANENKATLKENGIYEVTVKATETQVNLEAIANQELAYVSVDGNTETRGSNTKQIDMSTETTKQITITVKSISGKEKQYTIKIHRLSAITGKIITQAADQTKQTATIKVYNSQDTRDENDAEDPRKVIKEIQINPDGTYTLDLEPGEYDIVISKTSYLEHRVTNIVVKDGEIITINDINIYAGDLDENEEIEIEDLTSIIENYGTITDDNKAQKAQYDLNEDGIVNKQDRSILKANYGKTKTTEKWVDPNPPAKKVARTRKVTKQENTASSQNFVEPLKSQYTITSEYGTRTHPTTGEVKKHTGIDLAGTHHAEVVSIADGEVTYAGVQKGFGNSVEIKHIVNGEIIYSFYAHLSRIDVQKGQKVKQSQTIGLEGGDPKTDPNVGNSTGHHLHFEIRKASGYGNDIDPKNFLGTNLKNTQN